MSQPTQYGAARIATILLRDFEFNTHGLNRLEIVIADGKVFSRRVAESVGALDEGVQRLRLSLSTAAYDGHMYALINPNTTGYSCEH